jgi:hypothetical protein
MKNEDKKPVMDWPAVPARFGFLHTYPLILFQESACLVGWVG